MSSHDHDVNEPGIRRRELLLGGAATLGLATTALPALAAEPEPRVRAYRNLGRTGLQISDISFGSSRLSSDVDLVRRALDLGMNYFDTAESYRDGASEETLGKALAGSREKIFLASKTHCDTDTPRAQMMEALEASLRRLKTDRIEIYFNHAVNDVDRLKNGEWGEFLERAKQQGKIRFSGMSGHGGNLIECLDYAIEKDMIDVMLVGYNFGQDPAFYEGLTRSFDRIATQPELPKVIERAKKKNIGVIAMKTLMGGRLNDLRKYERPGGTYSQAAFRWVLSNPSVDALIVSITSLEQLREYLGASGHSTLRAADMGMMQRYLALNGSSFCQIGCALCVPACPDQVQVPDALRSRMYAVDYGDLELARDAYRAAGEPAAACATCSHRSCLGACPNGLDIAALTRESHALLGA